MLHEDRILKSIDLLTFNARETLNKYVEWATTANADVTFNLFDALSSYNKNGTTGSAAYLKPLTIPSFASISSGIFGDVGTKASRDIYWNFDFVSNGSGWSFNEYVQSNGSVAKNPARPVLRINTNTVFGNHISDGKISTVSFQNNTILLKYADKTYESLRLTNDRGILIFPNFSINGKDSVVLFGSKVSIGSNYANKIDENSTTSYQTSSISDLLYIDSKDINLRQFENNQLFNVLSSSDSIKLGDKLNKKNYIQYSADINIDISGSYALSMLGENSPSYLLAYDHTSLNAYAFSTEPANPINTAYVGNGIRRLASNTQEGFQFFVKNSTNSNNTPNTFFDVWVEGGLILGNRVTSIYNDFNNSISDSNAIATSTTNPYYLNVGTKGRLLLEGQDSLSLKSNNSIDVLIGNSPEISISKGSVVIPNLNLPSLQRIGLSTLSKNKSLIDGPYKLLPTHNLIAEFESCEVNTVDVFNPSIGVIKPQEGILSSYNTDTTNMYSYLFYSEEQSNGSHNLYSKTYTSNIDSGIDPTQSVNPVLVGNFDYSIDNSNAIAVSGVVNNYILVLSNENRSIYRTRKILIYSSSDRGVTYSLVKSINYSYNNENENIISINATLSTIDTVSCGYVDDIWISLVSKDARISLYSFNSYSKEVLTYDNVNSDIRNVSTDIPYEFTAIPNSNINQISLSSYNEPSSAVLCMIINVNNKNYSRGYFVQYKKIDGTIKKIFNQIIQPDNTTTNTMKHYSNGIVSVSGNIVGIDFIKYSYNNSNSLFGLGLVSSNKLILDVNINSISVTSHPISLNTAITSRFSYGSYYSVSTYEQRMSSVFYGQISSTYSLILWSLIPSTTTIKKRAFSINSFYENYIKGRSDISVTPMNFASICINYSETTTVVDLNYDDYVDNATIFERYSAELNTSTFTQRSLLPLSMVNSYNKHYRASYIDTLGLTFNGKTNICYYGSCGSDIVDVKISNYMLDDNNIGEYVSTYYSTQHLSPIAVVSTIPASNVITKGFKTLTYVSSSKAPATNNNVNYVTIIDNKVVTNPKIPISIIHSNSTSSVTLSRDLGIATSIVIGNGYDSISGKFNIPVEAISLFTKRAYSSNYDTLIRDDFKLSFVSTSNRYSGSTDNLVLATLTINDYNNCGHDLWVNRKNISDSVVSEYKDNSSTYSNDSTYEFLLIYDNSNNRTLVFSGHAENSYLKISNDTDWLPKGNSSLMSIDSTLLNPYDENFNSYLSIVNEKANVVSIRIDDVNSIRMQKNFNNGGSDVVGLILGYSEINNQEGSC